MKKTKQREYLEQLISVSMQLGQQRLMTDNASRIWESVAAQWANIYIQVIEWHQDQMRMLLELEMPEETKKRLYYLLEQSEMKKRQAGADALNVQGVVGEWRQ